MPDRALGLAEHVFEHRLSATVRVRDQDRSVRRERSEEVRAALAGFSPQYLSTLGGYTRH